MMKKRLTPIPTKIIRGTIISDLEPVSANWNRQALMDAFNTNGLLELISDGEWGIGGIGFNSFSSFSGSGRNSGKGKYAAAREGERFVKALANVMQTETAQELHLSGYFSVSIDTGDEPVMIRVDIQDGEVTYQQAEYKWPEPVRMAV